MRISMVLLIILVIRLLSRGEVLAEAESQPNAVEAKTDVPWVTMNVRVVDPDGRPVDNATVRPCGFRTPAAVARKMDPRPVKTNAEGMATVQFPKSVFWTDWQPLLEVHLVTTHPNYCNQKFILKVPEVPDEIVHELKVRRGIRIRVGGFEAGQDQPLKHCHVLLENRDTDEPDFVELEDGWLQSAPLPEERRWFRLVQGSEDGSLRFSHHSAWDPNDGADQVVRLDVRPGVRLAGQLSENVVRPITHGRVVVWCAPPHRPGAQKPAEPTESSWWIDTTPIAADGTFEFRSLPNGYIAQCYAVANDAISSAPSHQAIEQCSRWLDVPFANQEWSDREPRSGQIVRLTSKSNELKLQMEPAATACVRIIDVQGKPLAGIGAHSCPVQTVIGLTLRNSAVFCYRRSTLEELLGTYEPSLRTNTPYSAVTDADGRATLHNLPPGVHRIFAVKGALTNGQGQECLFQGGKISDVIVTLRVVSP